MTNQGLSLELPMIDLIYDESIINYGNYVGLLTCTKKDTEALLGILLTTTHNENSHNHKYRLAVDSGRGDPAMTFLVGPKLAAAAVPMRFTITNLIQSSEHVRGRYTTHKHILFKVSELDPDFAYTPRRGKGFWFGDGAHHHTSTWNHDAQVLTIKNMGQPVTMSCMNFTFEPTRKDSRCRGFTILVLGTRAFVHKDMSLSSEEERRCFQSLRFPWMNTDEEEEVVLTMDDGRQYMLVVTVTSSVSVHTWDLVTVYVDPVEITGLSKHDIENKRHYMQTSRNPFADSKAS